MKIFFINRYVISLLFLGNVLFTSDLYAQSLDSLVKATLQKNPSLIAAEKRAIAAKHIRDASRFLPPPTLIFEAAQIPVNSMDIVNDALSNGIGFSQMIPLGKKLSASARVNEMNAYIAESEVSELKLILVAKVKETYYKYFMSKKNEEIYKEQQKYLQLMKEFYTKNLSFAGGSTEIYLLETEIAKLRISIAGENSKQSELNSVFASLLGLSSFTMAFNDELSFPECELNDSVLTECLQKKNPSLKKLGNMIKMTEAEVEMNERELFPDMMLEAMIMRMPKGMPITSSALLHSLPPESAVEYMFTLRASLTLPFLPWSKGKIIAKDNALRNTIEGIWEEKKSMYLSMLADLRQAVIKFRQNRNSAEQYKVTIVPSLEKVLEVQLSQLKNGSVQLTQILNTLSMVVMEKMKYYKYVTDAWLLLTEIEMITGMDLNSGEEL